jgi:hypothetical protein
MMAKTQKPSLLDSLSLLDEIILSIRKLLAALESLRAQWPAATPQPRKSRQKSANLSHVR